MKYNFYGEWKSFLAISSQVVISGKEAGNLAMLALNFEVFPKFPLFVKP